MGECTINMGDSELTEPWLFFSDGLDSPLAFGIRYGCPAARIDIAL